MEEESNLQNPQTKHPNQHHLPPPRQLQRQNMRHRQRYNHEIRNHIQCSCTNIHRIPITAHTFDGCDPILSERAAEEECFEDYGEGPGCFSFSCNRSRSVSRASVQFLLILVRHSFIRASPPKCLHPWKTLMPPDFLRLRNSTLL